MPNSIGPGRDRILAWIADHRGKCSEIAEQTGFSANFVSLVLYGQKRSKDGKIERLLRKAGAPVARG